MQRRLAGPEHFMRVDWKKAVCALSDYAYRALAPDTTWTEARIMARAAISVALDPATDEWDPREETFLRHLGLTLREMVFVQDERGRGRRARGESPDWEIAKRTYAIDEMRKMVNGRAGLRLSTADYFRARRRVRAHAVDVCRELPAPPKRREPRAHVSREEELMDVILSSTDQDNFEDTMPRELLEEFVRDLGGDPEALRTRLEPWIQQKLDERAQRLAQTEERPPPGVGSA